MNAKILTTQQLIDYCKASKWTLKVLFVDIHHTESPDHASWAKKPDGLYWQQVMWRYHTGTRKFRDIGQHLTLLPNGMWVTGRDFNWTPASGLGAQNNNAFMIETLGNFDVGKDRFIGAQAENMFRFLAWFLAFKGYTPTIRFHRELSGAGKTCPGTSMNKAEFISAVKDFGIYKL